MKQLTSFAFLLSLCVSVSLRAADINDLTYDASGATVTITDCDTGADSDHDGLNALLEHAMGTSDAVADRMEDLLSVSLVAGNLLEISLQRNLAAEDMQFTVQASADLAAWDDLSVELQLTQSDYRGGGIALESYRVASPGARRFVCVVFARRQ
ncbi:MAG: hypothetical protein VCA55_05440 [Verrucomicrobiales bacterium]